LEAVLPRRLLPHLPLLRSARLFCFHGVDARPEGIEVEDKPGTAGVACSAAAAQQSGGCRESVFSSMTVGKNTANKFKAKYR